MSSARALTPALETAWTILSGTMKGATRRMNSAQFTMGRSNECDFVIVNDPKASRKHAMVTTTVDACEIACLNENNPILINGRESTHARLKDGDVVVIGETEMRFNVEAGGIQLEIPQSMPMAMPQYSPAPQPRPRATAKKPKPGGNAKRFAIFAVIGLLLWLVLSDNKKKKEAYRLRNEQQIQADIDAATKLKEAAENMNSKRMDGTAGRQAQENYVRGFRDYGAGQYERALISLQACLALNPEHTLCNRYLRLAQRRFNELIQYHTVLGRKYRDQNQFKSCRASFRNVMVMVKDSSSPIYKEAKANYEACNSFVEGRF